MHRSYQNHGESTSSKAHSSLEESIETMETHDRNGRQNQTLHSLLEIVRTVKSTGISNLSKPQTVRTLIRMCNKYACNLLKQGRNDKALDLLECAKKTVGSPLLQAEADISYLKASIYYNLSIYSHQLDNRELAVKFLKNAMQHENQVPDLGRAICYNNLASLYFKNANFDKALKYCRAAVALVEEYVYSTIKEAGSNSASLKENTKFMKELQVLLVGYLLSGISIEALKQSNHQSNILHDVADEKTLYINGEKISNIFNGPHHQLTQKFKKCLQRLEIDIPEPKTPPKTSSSKPAKLDFGKVLNDMSLTQSKRDQSKEFIIRKRSQSNTVMKEHKKAGAKDFDSIDTDNSEMGNAMASSISRKNAPRHQVVAYRKSGSSTNRRRRSKSMKFEDAVEFFLHAQRELEDRITKRLQQNLKMSQRVEEDAQTKKYRELEEQIQQLRTQNELHQKIKFEREIELERLRLRKTSELAFPGMLHGSSFPGLPTPMHPAYLPHYSSYPFMLSQPTDEAHLGGIQTNSGSITNPLSLSNPVIGSPFQGGLSHYFQRPRSISHGASVSQFETTDFEDKNTHHNISTTTKEHSASITSNNLSKTKTSRHDATAAFTENAFKSESVSNTNTENAIKSLKETEGGSLTSMPTPKLSCVTSPIQFPGRSSQGKNVPSLHLEDEDAKPIYKLETFGSNMLGALVNELRKSTNNADSQAHSGMTTIYGGLSNNHETSIGNAKSALANEPSTPSKAEHLLLADSKVTTKTFTTQLPQIDEVYSRMIGKGHLSPTGEETESNEVSHSGRNYGAGKDSIIEDVPIVGRKRFSDSDKKESMKSMISNLTDQKQSNQDKHNTSLSKLVRELDVDEDSGDEKFFMKKDSSFSILNPNDDFESPKPCDLLDYPDLLQFPDNSKITKTCFEFSETQKYKIECILEKLDTEMWIKIILTAADSTAGESSSPLAIEIVKMKDLRKVLKHVEYQDVLPLTASLKTIKTFTSFMKYCFVPFVWICPGSDQKLIQLRAKAKGLLNEDFTQLFFGESCVVGLHYLSHTNFRVVLTHLITGASFRIEVNLEDSSFDKFFERFSEKPVENQSEEILDALDILEDDEADAEQLQELTALVKKAESNDRIDAEIQSCKFKGPNEEKTFTETLLSSIREIEAFYSESLGCDSFAKIALSPTTKFTKLRYFQDGKRRNLSFMVESPETERYKVYMKNLFETYAPDGAKIQAEGNCEYKFDSFCHDFGVHYRRLDLEDRIAFCSLVTDCFKLETHDKPIDDEDKDSYEPNPIVHMPVDQGCFLRIFKGNDFRYPTTFTLIGVRGYPVGVKVTVFSPEECIESGVFMFLEPISWKKVPKQLKPGEKKKRTRKFVGLPMIEEYNLAQILKGYGFRILDDYVTFDNMKRVSVVGVRSMRGFSNVDRLENAITIQNVIRYLRKNNAELFEELQL